MIFIQTFLSFVLSRKIINIYNDVVRTYGNVAVKDFQKHEKLEYKKNKLKLDIDFLNNCKQLGVYPKFLVFKLPNVSNKGALSRRVKDSFVAPSTSVMKNYNIFQNNSVYPKTFYVHSFLVLTSTYLHNLKHRITRNRCRIIKHSTKKVIFTDEGLQLTYIHS